MIVTCPCGAEIQGEHEDAARLALAKHLHDVHGIATVRAPFVAALLVDGKEIRPEDLATIRAPRAHAALPTANPNSAPAAPPAPQEGERMARPCGNCKKVGHGKAECPDLLEEQARQKKGAKKRTGGGKTRAVRPEPSVSTNGTSPVAKIRTVLDAAAKSIDEARSVLAELEPDLAQLGKVRELLAAGSSTK